MVRLVFMLLRLGFSLILSFFFIFSAQSVGASPDTMSQFRRVVVTSLLTIVDRYGPSEPWRRAQRDCHAHIHTLLDRLDRPHLVDGEMVLGGVKEGVVYIPGITAYQQFVGRILAQENSRQQWQQPFGNYLAALRDVCMSGRYPSATCSYMRSMMDDFWVDGRWSEDDLRERSSAFSLGGLETRAPSALLVVTRRLWWHRLICRNRVED